jgi:hypothetical protein
MPGQPVGAAGGMVGEDVLVEKPPGANSHTILVVEDEGLLATDIQMRPEMFGYCAPGHREFRQGARSTPFDLVLTSA